MSVPEKLWVRPAQWVRLPSTGYEVLLHGKMRSAAEEGLDLRRTGGRPELGGLDLWVLNLVSPGEVIGTIQFKRSEFAGQAVADLVTAYRRILRRMVSAPDDKLGAG